MAPQGISVHFYGALKLPPGLYLPPAATEKPDFVMKEGAVRLLHGSVVVNRERQISFWLRN